MKTIKFWNIPNKIKELSFDGDKTDLRLHSDANFRWGAKGIRQYNKTEKEIDKFEIQGNGWLLYAGYDTSGFHYWMKNMEETNYIMLAIMFEKVNINVDEIDKIETALYNAIDWAKGMEQKYNYDPSPYCITK